MQCTWAGAEAEALSIGGDLTSIDSEAKTPGAFWRSGEPNRLWRINWSRVDPADDLSADVIEKVSVNDIVIGSIRP
jgi:hypothetical protein